MKITSSEQTALRCMMRLAQNGHGTMSVGQIANQEGMAEPFTAKILAKLRRAGLIHAVRGRSGGYALAESPAEINVENILSAVADPLFDRSYCARSKNCVRDDDCAIRPVWERINALMYWVLERVTLEELLNDEASVEKHLAEIAPLRNSANAASARKS